MKLYLFVEHTDSNLYIPAVVNWEVEIIMMDPDIAAEEFLGVLFLQLVHKSFALKHEKIMFCMNGDFLNNIVDIERILSGITLAERLNANVVLFNAKGVNLLMPISSGYFWIDNYTKSDFFLLEGAFLSKILQKSKEYNGLVHSFLSSLTSNKILMSPMLTSNPDREFSILAKRMYKIASKFIKLRSNQSPYTKFK